MLKDQIFYHLLKQKLDNNKIYEDIIEYKLDNKTLIFTIKIIPNKDHVIYIAKDITNEKKYKKILEEIKKIDKLTGFLTKEAFINKIKKIIELNPNS